MTNKELFEAAAGMLREYVNEVEASNYEVALELGAQATSNLAQWFQAESHATTYNPASLRLARSLVEDE